MASIARCLRVSGPSSVRILARPALVRLATRAPVARHFSVSPTSLIKKYTIDHEWIDVSADGKTAVIGISTYAAEQLGDVVYVELPETGTAYAQGDALGAVESVKSASDINAPVGCTVVEVNDLLEEKPATINRLPEDDAGGGGWIARVELDEATAAEELAKLMDKDEYKAYTASDH